MTAADLIAQTLRVHQTYADWAIRANRYHDICSCGWRGALTSEQSLGDLAAAHQATAVTEALGLVEEWGVRYGDGPHDVDNHYANNTGAREHLAELLDPDVSEHGPTVGAHLVTRYVTPWTKETDR